MFDRADRELFSVLFFSTAGLARTTDKQYEGKTGEGLGSGLGAGVTLEARYNATTKELRRSLNDKLTNTYFTRRTTGRTVWMKWRILSPTTVARTSSYTPSRAARSTSMASGRR